METSQLIQAEADDPSGPTIPALRSFDLIKDIPEEQISRRKRYQSARLDPKRAPPMSNDGQQQSDAASRRPSRNATMRLSAITRKSRKSHEKMTIEPPSADDDLHNKTGFKLM